MRLSDIPYGLFRELSIGENRDATSRSEIPRLGLITFFLQKSVIWLNASKLGDLCVVFYVEM
jgi:hypothetical protein